MGVGDVRGRCQIGIELLHLRQREGIMERRQSCLRMGLRHIQQQRGSLGQHAAFRGQRGHPALGIDAQVFGAALLVVGKAQRLERELGIGLIKRNQYGLRAGASCVVKRGLACQNRSPMDGDMPVQCRLLRSRLNPMNRVCS